MQLVAVIGLTTSQRRASMNCNKATDADFIVKGNAVRTYSRVLHDLLSKKQACDIANGLLGQFISGEAYVI